MKPLNIVYIAQFAGSPKHGMQLGQYSLAQQWVRMGHFVTIVSSSNAHMRFKQPVVKDQYQTETIDGIRYIWVKTPRYVSNNKFDRIKNLFLYCYRSWSRTLPVSKADLVICSTPSPLSIFSAARLSRRVRAKLVYEVRDLWPLTLMELSKASKWNPFIILMQFSENYAYKNAHFIVSVLSNAKGYMEKHGMDRNKFVHIPNGINTDFTLVESLPTLYVRTLKALKSKGVFLVGYTGKVGISNTVHTLIESIKYCDDVHLVVMGFGEQLLSLKEMVKELELNNRVSFFDPLPKEQVGSFLSFIDVAYVGWVSSSLYKYGMSSTKLNDYFLAGKPIICASDIQDEALLSSKAGTTCPAENPRELAKAIHWMQSIGFDKRILMGKNGHDWVIKNKSYSVLAKQYIAAVMSEVLSE